VGRAAGSVFLRDRVEGLATAVLGLGTSWWWAKSTHSQISTKPKGRGEKKKELGGSPNSAQKNKSSGQTHVFSTRSNCKGVVLTARQRRNGSPDKERVKKTSKQRKANTQPGPNRKFCGKERRGSRKSPKKSNQNLSENRDGKKSKGSEPRNEKTNNERGKVILRTEHNRRDSKEE